MLHAFEFGTNRLADAGWLSKTKPAPPNVLLKEQLHHIFRTSTRGLWTDDILKFSYFFSSFFNCNRNSCVTRKVSLPAKKDKYACGEAFKRTFRYGKWGGGCRKFANRNSRVLYLGKFKSTQMYGGPGDPQMCVFV